MSVETLQSLVWTAFVVYAATMVVITIIIVGMADNHKREADALRKQIDQRDFKISNLNDRIDRGNAERSRLLAQRIELLDILEADE